MGGRWTCLASVTWETHEMARQRLLGPNSDLPERCQAVVLAIRVTMPSGTPQLAALRESILIYGLGQASVTQP